MPGTFYLYTWKSQSRMKRVQTHEGGKKIKGQCWCGVLSTFTETCPWHQGLRKRIQSSQENGCNLGRGDWIEEKRELSCYHSDHYIKYFNRMLMLFQCVLFSCNEIVFKMISRLKVLLCVQKVVNLRSQLTLGQNVRISWAKSLGMPNSGLRNVSGNVVLWHRIHYIYYSITFQCTEIWDKVKVTAITWTQSLCGLREVMLSSRVHSMENDELD